jgi:hypothetical protein
VRLLERQPRGQGVRPFAGAGSLIDVRHGNVEGNFQAGKKFMAVA